MKKQTKKIASQDTKKYERLLRGFSSAANSLVMYPAGHPIVERQLQETYQAIAEVLKTDNVLSIHKGEGVFVVNDIQISTTSKAAEKFFQHFDNFKITDLEISNGLSLEEFKNFLEIFIHSEESVGLYESLNEACEKNQITNIKSLQAAYIRVSKNVKDRLGGKTVGELKISKEEMARLISYLKGEVDLADPKELKTYEKVFKNPNLLTSLIDKIVIDSAKLPAEERKKMVIVVLNQTGKYLSQLSTSAHQQNEAAKMLTTLQKVLLTDSQTFVTFGSDPQFREKINQTVEQIKSLVKNQAIVAEYNKHREKLQKLGEKIKTIAPQILNIDTQAGMVNPNLKKFLLELKEFLEKLSQTKQLTEPDCKKINSFVKRLDEHINKK